MDECLQIILRKQEDGINYEAVLQTYCGGWGDVSYGCGCTQSDALYQLERGMEIDIDILARRLDAIRRGYVEVIVE